MDQVYRVKDLEIGDLSPVILVGNKSDAIELRQVTFKMIKEMVGHYKIPFVMSSAKQNLNIQTIFEQSFLQHQKYTAPKATKKVQKRETKCFMF